MYPLHQELMVTGRFAYSSSKAAIISTLSIPKELSSYNIRVNVKEPPGLTGTDLTRDIKYGKKVK